MNNIETPFKTEEQKRIHREFCETLQLRNECNSKMVQLRKDFCDTFPFKVDDYITFGKICGWVSRMIMSDGLDYLNLYYNPPKKDGTRSRIERFEYIYLMRGELDNVKVQSL